MGKTFSEIESEAMALPVNERAALARDLIESLDIDDDLEISDEWLAEVDRRCADFDNGKIKSRPAEDVILELRKKYPS